MKKELIKTDNYLLVVDDSEIKDVRPHKGMWHLEGGNILNKFPDYLTDLSECKLVITHLPLNGSPVLEGVPLLPPYSQHQEDGIDELAEEFYPLNDELYPNSSLIRKAFLTGYNKSREKYKFTEEDMINFACKVYNENYHKDDSFFTTAKTLINSFSQPKTPTHFEFEMVRGDFPYYVIKTTTNSQGQQVACGKYIYEL